VQTLPVDKINVVCGCIWAVAIIKKKEACNIRKKQTNYELVNFLKYELCTELVHFKMCELNFELVHVQSELSQHWFSHHLQRQLCT